MATCLPRLRVHCSGRHHVPITKSMNLPEFAWAGRVCLYRSRTSRWRCIHTSPARLSLPTVKGPPPRSKPPPFRTRQHTSSDQARIERIFRSGDQVLLFKSSGSKGLYIWSYTLGAILIFGSWGSYQQWENDRALRQKARFSWLTTAASLTTATFLLVAGIVIMSTPVKTIRSVTAVANRSGQHSHASPKLICEMQNPLPFMPRKDFEVAPSDIFLNRRLTAIELNIRSVPLSAAGSFTEAYLSSRERPGRTLGEKVSAFNDGLVNAWPSLKRLVRKIMLREGMAKIHCRGRGVWKLDMDGCELLERGQPLELLSSRDPNVGLGILGNMLQRIVGDQSTRR